jgi:hypothetical protein
MEWIFDALALFSWFPFGSLWQWDQVHGTEFPLLRTRLYIKIRFKTQHKALQSLDLLGLFYYLAWAEVCRSAEAFIYIQSPLTFSLFSGENGRCHVNASVREHQNFGNTKTLARSTVQAPLHRLYRLHFTGFTGSTSSIDFTGSIGSTGSLLQGL